MAELNFASGAELDLEPGVKSYPISGGRGSICFNPTDTMFVEAVYSMLVRFADQMEQDKAQKFDNALDMFRHQRERDEGMKADIDTLFGAGTSGKLFRWVDENGDDHQISPAALSSGLPLWTNFILAVIDVIPDEVSAQVKKTDARVNKYLAKYKKYQK